MTVAPHTMPSSQGPCSTAATEHRLAGRLPNVYRHAVSLEELRQSQCFLALPPVSWIALAGGSRSYRYVRQEDPLWSRLHQGRLTTGYLAQTLGFCEPLAAKRLGLPKSRISHQSLLNAYHRLLLPPFQPTQQQQQPGGEAAAAAAAAAERHNALAVARFNAGKAQVLGLPEAPPADCLPDVPELLITGAAELLQPPQEQQQMAGAGGSGGGRSNNKKKKKKGRGSMAAASSLAAGAQMAGSTAINVSAAEAAAVTAAPEGSSSSRQEDETAGLSEELKLKVARSLAQQGPQAVCCAWGKAQEAASLASLAALLPPTAVLAEVGLCCLEAAELPPGLSFAPGALPPIGASPDGLLLWLAGTSGMLDMGADTTATAAAAEGAAEGVAGGAAEAMASGLLPPPGEECWAAGAQQVAEVVEVKNVCPFSASRHRQGAAEPYLVSDPGPRRHLKADWVPQLQLHMLCAGTRSGLLVSRSATKGLHVFRMPRDDVYLELLLRMLSRVWVEHAQRRRPPPLNVFHSWHDYNALLTRTVALARTTPLVLAVPACQQPGGDPRLFLD